MASLLAFVSCENLPEEDIQVAIKSVKGTATISLDERADWSLLVNENEYETHVKGRTIHAIPRADGLPTYYTIYGSHTMDSMPNLKPGSLRLLFAAPNYPFKDKLTVDEIVDEQNHSAKVIEVYDQSTYDKMIAVDALVGVYTNWLSPYIENVKLEHRHNRLNFSIEGLPADGKMRLMCKDKQIQPYVNEGVSSAILVYTKGTDIEVEVAGKVIQLPMLEVVKKVSPDKRVSKNIIYQLLLKYNANAQPHEKVLDFEIAADKWSVLDMTPVAPEEGGEPENVVQ